MERLSLPFYDILNVKIEERVVLIMIDFLVLLLVLGAFLVGGIGLIAFIGTTFGFAFGFLTFLVEILLVFISCYRSHKKNIRDWEKSVPSEELSRFNRMEEAIAQRKRIQKMNRKTFW